MWGLRLEAQDLNFIYIIDEIDMKRIILLLSLICSVVQAQERVVVLNTDTQEKRFIAFPSRTDTVIGLDSNLKIYYILEKPKPSYDNITERLDLVKTFTDSIGEGKKYPYYVYSYEVVALDSNTIRQNKELAVLQKELELMLGQISDEQFKQFTIMAVGLLLYEMQGGNITNRMNTEVVTPWMNKAIKVWQNYTNKLDLIQELQNNVNTDINQNWTP